LYETGYFEDNATFEAGVAKYFDTPPPELVRLVKCGECFKSLIKLYILSDMLLYHQTANMMVDEMIHTHDLVEWTPLAESVKLLWSSTLAGDGMRNLICDWFVTSLKVNRPGGLNTNNDWPADFLKDLVMALMRYEGNEEIKQLNPSYPANYCANWDPSQGQHRYHTEPGPESKQLGESTDGGHRKKRQCV